MTMVSGISGSGLRAPERIDAVVAPHRGRLRIADIEAAIFEVAIEQQRLRGDLAMLADPAFAEDRAAGPQGEVAAENRVGIVVAADPAALIAHEIIGIGAAPEHGGERVDEQEDARQLD